MAQPDSLSSVPKTHTVEGKDPTPSVSFWPQCVCCSLCACTQSIHTISEEIFLWFFLLVVVVLVIILKQGFTVVLAVLATL